MSDIDRATFFPAKKNRSTLLEENSARRRLEGLGGVTAASITTNQSLPERPLRHWQPFLPLVWPDVLTFFFLLGFAVATRA
jgi:hypothetical protein